MKKLVFVLLLLITSVGISHAQVLDPVLGPRAWQKENVEQSDAVTLTHIREADVMWSKRIWRTIDLRQKINLILYYPVMDSATLGKRSFVQVIFDEFINNPQNIGPNRVRMYESYQLSSLDEMTREEVLDYITPSDSASVEEEASAVAQTDEATEEAPAEDDWGSDDFSDDGGGSSDFVIIKKRVKKEFFDVKPDITKIELMEDWFFDKQRSVLDVRILAIGINFPVWEMKESLNADDVTVFGGWDKKGEGKTIWFYFPALRNELAKHECYKRHNDAARVSYDDIFLSRMFGSYITKEENVYDRYINQYTGGLDALLEAEKISNEIEEFEQNLWEY
jgi:gliding motility associated protien GldN